MELLSIKDKMPCEHRHHLRWEYAFCQCYYCLQHFIKQRQGCTVSNTDESNLLSNVCIIMNGHPVVECICIYNTFLSGHVVIHCKKHPQQYVLSSTQLSGINLLSIQVKSNNKMQTVSHSWYTSADIQNYTLLKQKVTLGQIGILFTLREKPRPMCFIHWIKNHQTNTDR